MSNRVVSDSRRTPFADFSYGYLRVLLRAMQERFELTLLRDAHSAGSERPRLVLRHDIDVWLPAALSLATVESEMGVRSTYLVQVDSPMYSLDTPESRAILAGLLERGHEVGLHLWVGDLLSAGDGQIERRIASAAGRLAEVTGSPVRSMSFHRPAPSLLRGPRAVGGIVSGYARELMGLYLSDSEGRWREGDPLPMLREARVPLAQVLIHPIWWDETHQSPGDRLQDFFDAQTQGLSRKEKEDFDEALDNAVFPARRTGRA